MRTLVAAAVHEGDVVVLERQGHRDEVKVDVVQNGTPRPGLITWFTSEGETIELPAVARLQIVSLV